jgi:hypothetical protein
MPPAIACPVFPKTILATFKVPDPATAFVAVQVRMSPILYKVAEAPIDIALALPLLYVQKLLLPVVADVIVSAIAFTMLQFTIVFDMTKAPAVTLIGFSIMEFVIVRAAPANVLAVELSVLALLNSELNMLRSALPADTVKRALPLAVFP